MKTLKYIARVHGQKSPAGQPVPIVVAGDLFHKWNSTAELINFALEHLPDVHAIRGNHDTPHDNGNEIGKSAYWTLVKAGKITNLPDRETVQVGPSANRLSVQGFPTGGGFVGGAKRFIDCVNWTHLAVVHAYCWQEGHAFPGVSKEDHVAEWSKRLKGFDAAAFGDNHRGFYYPGTNKLPSVLNCGTLMRRRSDEIDYKPAVGILYEGGRIERTELDCSEDRFVEVPLKKELDAVGIDADELMELLTDAAGEAVSFVDAVKLYCRKHKVRPLVKDVLRSILDEGKKT